MYLDDISDIEQKLLLAFEVEFSSNSKHETGFHDYVAKDGHGLLTWLGV